MNVYQMSEEQRASRRQQARRELAEIQITKNRISEVRTQLEALEADTDRATDQHAETTKPIQAELVTIQTEQVDAIAGGKTVSAKSEARRKQLLSELDAANGELEETTVRNKALAKGPRQELAKLQSETVRAQVIANSIAMHGTDKDLDESWVIEQRNNWCVARVKAAHDKLTSAQGLLVTATRQRQEENKRIYERRCRRWQLVVAEAQQDMSSARAAADAHREKLLSVH